MAVARAFRRGLHEVEKRIDALRERRGWLGRGAPRIEAYRGFGVRERAFVKGRVLRGNALAAAAEGERALRRLAAMLRRFESDEVPHARVLVRHPGGVAEARADDEGYFEAWIEPRPGFAEGTFWTPLEVELAEPEIDPAPRGTVDVLVPPRGCEYGVISDLDDTVIETGATSVLRMARTVLLSDARTRTPFAGVAAFYRALHLGPGGTPFRPLFYVSSSPWNLHDLLSELFALRDIPAGPMLLRDWGLRAPGSAPRGHAGHKLAAIRRLLGLYEGLPFVLIGDSGQEDPEIYAQSVAEHPGRVLAIYIRDVTRSRRRAERIAALAAEVERAGSTLVVAEDTLAAAEHAARRGWISAESLSEVAAEVRRTS